MGLSGTSISFGSNLFTLDSIEFFQLLIPVAVCSKAYVDSLESHSLTFGQLGRWPERTLSFSGPRAYNTNSNMRVMSDENGQSFLKHIIITSWKNLGAAQLVQSLRLFAENVRVRQVMLWPNTKTCIKLRASHKRFLRRKVLIFYVWCENGIKTCSFWLESSALSTRSVFLSTIT